MDRFGRRQLLLGGALGAAAVVIPGRAAAVAGPAAAVWDYPEHRSAAQLEADSAGVGRQVEALSSARGRDRAGQIIDRIRARQDAAPGPDGLPFDRYRSPGSGTEVLIARGQLTVRLDEPAADAAARLASFGYTPAGHPTPQRASRPRTGVFHAGKGPAQLAQDAVRLRKQGIDAAMNLVVPLGHTIKADDYPLATQGWGPAPAVTPAAVRVALVDTGIAAGARGDGWLSDAVVGPGHADPLDVLPAAGRLDWGAGHGTFTAGIVRRVAPRCEIVAYRFTRGDGLGTDADVAEMLLRAAADAHQAGVPTVINASLGTPAVDGVPPPAMRAAVEFIGANHPEVLIVASAGNMGSAEPMFPAAFGGVVAVGALTHDLRAAPFSSHGPWLRCSTVGVGVVSTFVPGVSPPEPDPHHPDRVFGADGWALWSGTSFSAPQISGAVARLCCDRPGLSPHAALDMLLADRPRLPGYGRVLRLLPGTPAA
ncbi:hypothetical protein DMB66_01415 [Actinoplanes sp. ATCC 53533]|uniref:S8 family peptidase n=1 Tax=Actinoplanes sp. ATCC 53533 TaxID=1288362 RepID=UPI000F7BA035|nr:S8/S53 family peptidase [Actinoplanes sp. ATCC 53533]RSM74120.1 hypothetical protein DMB66_01415 [Actinoplanes sp. ATCC 53533]